MKACFSFTRCNPPAMCSDLPIPALAGNSLTLTLPPSVCYRLPWRRQKSLGKSHPGFLNFHLEDTSLLHTFVRTARAQRDASLRGPRSRGSAPLTTTVPLTCGLPKGTQAVAILQAALLLFYNNSHGHDNTYAVIRCKTPLHVLSMNAFFRSFHSYRSRTYYVLSVEQSNSQSSSHSCFGTTP